MSGTISRLSEHENNQFSNVISVDTSAESMMGEKIKKKDVTGKWKPKNDESAPVKEGLTTVAHFCIFAFVLLILYLCFNEPFEFFTWHPFLLSIGVSIYFFY